MKWSGDRRRTEFGEHVASRLWQQKLLRFLVWVLCEADRAFFAFVSSVFLGVPWLGSALFFMLSNSK